MKGAGGDFLVIFNMLLSHYWLTSSDPADNRDARELLDNSDAT
jgi:hypothetical protein